MAGILLVILIAIVFLFVVLRPGVMSAILNGLRAAHMVIWIFLVMVICIAVIMASMGK